jgi:hypothetical protein
VPVVVPALPLTGVLLPPQPERPATVPTSRMALRRACHLRFRVGIRKSRPATATAPAPLFHGIDDPDVVAVLIEEVAAVVEIVTTPPVPVVDPEAKVTVGIVRAQVGTLVALVGDVAKVHADSVTVPT